MRYECSYGYDHLSGGGWDGSDYKYGLTEALDRVVGLRWELKPERPYIEVSAGREADITDVIQMHHLADWLEELAQERIWWDENSGDFALAIEDRDMPRVEAVLREVIGVYSYVTVSEIKLAIDWEKSSAEDRLVVLKEGEEARLTAWLEECEASAGEEE